MKNILPLTISGCKSALLTLFGVLVMSNAMGDNPPFLSEGFESGALPSGWSREYVKGTNDWRFYNGGYSPNDPNYVLPADANDPTRNPPSAHGGTYDAMFQLQSVNDEATKLITPAIDLGSAVKPQLNFWLAQVAWTFGGSTSWDALRVYYKTSAGGSWNLLATYDFPISSWTEYSLLLPNPTSTYYIAFEGTTQWGLGTCIDDISVVETGNQDRWVKSVTSIDGPIDFVPSGSSNNPMMGFAVNVGGNQGTCIFDSLEVKSLNTDDNDVALNGVKLYKTTSPIFSTTNLVAFGNFSSGYTLFNHLNLDLPSGENYFWIAYDASASAKHGDYLDAMIEANAMKINDTTYAATALSPAGQRIIYQTISFEDFETDNGWTLTGEFQRDTPTGLGGNPGNPDPATAFSGTKVLGTDLTGLGASPYNYEAGITRGTAYLATSPTFDVFYYKDLRLTYQRQLNMYIEDSAAVEVSKDNGLTWTRIGGNITPAGQNAFVLDSKWNRIENSIPASISRSKDFKVRFAIFYSTIYNYSGWNIDDLILTGEYITKDVSVVQWVSPTTKCGFGSAESITVKVANLAAQPTPDKVPLAISLDGGLTWVRDTINQIIPVGDTISYTFAPKFDLSVPGPRNNVLVKTELPGDQETDNDQLAASFYVIPTYPTPSAQDFELSDGFWRSTQGNLWEWGHIGKPQISSANSGSKAWITKLTGTYGSGNPTGETSAFLDDFESLNGWQLTGEFEIGPPNGLGGSDGGYPNPVNAYSGVNVLGTDLDGSGTFPNCYEPNITTPAGLSAISPAVNLSNYVSAHLTFYRYLNVAAGDTAKIDFSKDGTTWYSAWKSTDAITDGSWELIDIPIADSLLSSTFKVRFSIRSNATINYSGWNIDYLNILGVPFTSPVAILESPCMDFTNDTKPIFGAAINYQTEKGVDGAALYYSIDGGTTWTHIESNGDAFDSRWNWYKDSTVTSLGTTGWSGNSNGWKNVYHILPANVAGQSSVKFQLRFNSDRFNNDYDGVAFDDISFAEAPNDFGVTALVNPINSCTLTKNESVTVSVKNFGVRTAEAGDTVKVKLSIDRDGDIQSGDQSFILGSALPVNSVTNFTFTQKFDFNFGGTYNIVASTYGDAGPRFYYDTGNDTLMTSVVVNKPYVNLGPDIYTVRADTVVLDATASGPVTYNWYSPITNPTPITTTPIIQYPTIPASGGQFRVEVIGGCTAYDTIRIVKLISDVGILNLVSPVTACQLSSSEPFKINIKNFGTDTLNVGDSIALSWTINGGSTIQDTVVLQNVLLPDDTVEITTNKKTDFSAVGNYNVELYAKRPYDEVPANDHISSTITVHGFPTFNLPVIPSTIADTSYTIDAGSGWSSYLWQDGSTNQTFVMDTIGWVKATVTDGFSCPASDSAYINLKYTDISLQKIIYPEDICKQTLPVYPQVTVRNNGTDTLAIGDKVNVSYTVNGGTTTTDQVTLNTEFTPGETFNHTFSVPVNLTSAGPYSFVYWAEALTEMKPGNDTLKKIINVITPINLNLPPTVFTRNSQVVLDGGPGADSYLWNTGATTQAITVTTSGQYSLIATIGGACSAFDTSNVTFLHHDYALTQFVDPLDSCAATAGRKVSVRIYNNGNDTLTTAQSLSIVLNVNGSLNQTKIFQPSTDFIPGIYRDVFFDNPIDLSSEGSTDLTAQLTFASDINAGNNSTAKTINVWANPVVNLGPDQWLTGGNVVLNAGSGYSFYSWNTGATTPTITVSTSGTYFVTVTSDKGCTGSDEVGVSFTASAINITALLAPAPGCPSQDPMDVSVEVTNQGVSTLPSGTKIPLGYKYNDGETMSDTLALTSDLNAGDKINHTFADKVVINTAGNMSFKTFTYYNETQGPVSEFFVQTLPLPNFHFTIDTLKVNFPYVLSAYGGTSYLWNNGSTTATTIADGPGDYWVQVTGSNGCSLKDSVYVASLVSVGENDFYASLAYYPVPTTYILHVEATLKATTDVTIDVVDMLGIPRWSKKYINVDKIEEAIGLDGIKPGTYLLRISTPTGNAIKTIIISR
ncbi:MAG TPA: T9SS type A sorting domain-containing protein [Williamwhitmania sp.]|nr:T9SS type A sorting domain-containing protein [Williamwhitmania sp.]